MNDKDLYVLAFMRYKEKNPNKSDEELFPPKWDLSRNYHLKVEIIAEAIQKHILIEETDLYKNKFIDNGCIVSTENN